MFCAVRLDKKISVSRHWNATGVMKFKEGDWVEVFRRNEEPYGSWFPSKVLSVDVDKCAVRCELSATPDGRPIIEKVHERDVRPCPPHAPGTEHWMVGDIVEVFDAHSWRVGKIAKVLSDDYVVTKIFGSIQLKEFHVSNLRSRQAWQNNHWVMINKRTLQGHLKPQRVSIHDDEIRGTGRKRKASSKNEVYNLLDRRTLQQKLDDVTFSKSTVRENATLLKSARDRINMYTQMEADKVSSDVHFRNSSAVPTKVTEEIAECSVASCSGNDIIETANQNTRRHTRDIARNTFDHAMSLCPHEGGRESQRISGDKLAASIHELELHAYQSTMQALYASGPLSWEQESLLTNLRLSLNISNEEHLLHLRQLLSTEVL
uniref:ENT domain-containing protein n=1 Tax=Musa acuminata subsp. malaccensis TaxID=214687 RepID=A0A804JQZ0_MUSAM|nr:PREDICTED: uncharacterized protein LOC103990932 [Musa acuminata subsp. malaccensis]XP_009408511.1 PREDICTED: uncharacterized protein LOC103990932 [Musa acuminata subsp. malaccensis]XP_009408512.1 PREDICTED: uncharacterized protein LOC103990932 [Musa acuminata subsp. malaccensis]XP_018684562.1 PREDICTED: uncharacterized protein LOC103990932 [Musa acuminata subsp. malaccensis]